jgi:hypothetical protein
MTNLTPAEREALAAATPQDVTRAVAELITDPGFWGGLIVAFLQGMARGFEKRR